MRRVSAFFYRNRWLFSRRVMQLLIIAAFAVELPDGGYFAQGNLSSSTWFGMGLTDPYIWLQSMLAGAPLGKSALIGMLIVAVLYANLLQLGVSHQPADGCVVLGTPETAY